MTLIEIIIAIGFIGILAVAFIAVFIATYSSVITSGQRNQEIHYARSELESAIVSDAYTSSQITRSSYTVNIFGETIHGTLIRSEIENTNDNLIFFKPN